jgi:hypothetical protein
MARRRFQSNAAAREQAQVGHERRERGTQLQNRLLGSNGLGRDPGHEESRVAAVGEVQERMG